MGSQSKFHLSWRFGCINQAKTSIPKCISAHVRRRSCGKLAGGKRLQTMTWRNQLIDTMYQNTIPFVWSKRDATDHVWLRAFTPSRSPTFLAHCRRSWRKPLQIWRLRIRSWECSGSIPCYMILLKRRYAKNAWCDALRCNLFSWLIESPQGMKPRGMICIILYIPRSSKWC